MGHWSILCVCVCVFFCVIVVSKGPVSSTPSSSSSSSTTPGAAGAGASPSPASQVSPSLALPLAQGERGSSPLHPLFSHSSPLLFPTSFFHSVSFVQSFGTDTKRTKKEWCNFFHKHKMIHHFSQIQTANLKVFTEMKRSLAFAFLSPQWRQSQVLAQLSHLVHPPRWPLLSPLLSMLPLQPPPSSRSKGRIARDTTSSSKNKSRCCVNKQHINWFLENW